VPKVIQLKKTNQLKRLVAIRTELGMTQQFVAEALKTTQQTVARWETGQTEPSLAQLRDLAMIFGMGVADILGNERKIESTYYCRWDEQTISGFWGHIGVLLPGAKFSKWYPITGNERDRAVQMLSDGDESLMLVSTLCNRLLVLNKQNLQRIWFLDDAADGPDEDWDNDQVAEHNPKEFYRVLDDAMDALFGGGSDYEASDLLKEGIKELIAKQSEEELYEMLHGTAVHLTDGHTIKFQGDPETLFDIIFAIDLGESSQMIHFRDESHEWDSFIAISKITMIEIPTLDYDKGSAIAMQDYEADSDETPVLPPVVVKAKFRKPKPANGKS
jgi:transcriptional regulator with XRE-family HTH domain